MKDAEIRTENVNRLRVLSTLQNFIDYLGPEDSAEVRAQLKTLEKGWTEKLLIKTLRGKIKELIIKQYRIVFFRKETMIYVVDAFKKQSKKTPLRIIERAEKIYKQIK